MLLSIIGMMFRNIIVKNCLDILLQINKTQLLTSKGYNVYQAADAAWGVVDTDTDYSTQTLPAASLTDGVYQWTVASVIDEFATRQAVIDAVKSFDATVGQQFVDWVGEEGFGVDQRGANCNINKMQPGAYDAGL